MSYRDKVKIAELEARIYVYEVALAAAGMQPLQVAKPKKEGIGFKI